MFSRGRLGHRGYRLSTSSIPTATSWSYSFRIWIPAARPKRSPSADTLLLVGLLGLAMAGRGRSEA